MITVVADDITGAAEIAGICLRYGIAVSFGIDAIPERRATVNVVATDTRSLSAADAYKRHFILAKAIRAISDDFIFKKVDSVLRGHVLNELLALSAAEEKEHILLQPANPQSKRCIVKASYYIDNIPIEKTGFAADPEFPATTSSVVSLLTASRSLNKAPEIFTGNIKSIQSQGVYVPDCESVEDLKTNGDLYSSKMLIAGSSAFFEQFLLKRVKAVAVAKPISYNFSKDYFLLSGSTHPNSIAFAKTLEKSNCPLFLFPNKLLEDQIDVSFLEDFSAQIIGAFLKSKRAVLRVSNTLIKQKGRITFLKARMSAITKRVLESLNVSELFIEGGATTYAVLTAMDWTTFTPISELAPGVIRMKHHNSSQHITIKPGSYHWPEGLFNEPKESTI